MRILALTYSPEYLLQFPPPPHGWCHPLRYSEPTAHSLPTPHPPKPSTIFASRILEVFSTPQPPFSVTGCIDSTSLFALHEVTTEPYLSLHVLIYL